MSKQNEGFSSILGFIMVAIGLALGIGTLWRFPYVVGENGGAIFIFLYILIILVIGIPLMTCEVTIGYATGNAAIDAYKTLKPNTKWYLAGYLHTLAALIIVGYTSVIYAWIIKYIAGAFMGDFVGLDSQSIQTYFDAFNANKTTVFIFFLINFALNNAVIILGVQKGIERVSKILIPVLFVIMIIIIFFGLRLPGAKEGITFLFKPDFSKFSFNSVITCLGQAFFALGLAMLGSMVFGSYIKEKDENIFKDSSVICLALVFAGILSGFMILPIVFATGLTPGEGVGLTFLTLPLAFNVVPFGRVLSILFYFGFYIAAFTSSVGVLEAIVGQFMERFKLERIKALMLASAIIVAIAAVSIFYDPAFAFLDNIESNYILVIGCLIIALFSARAWKMENLLEAANIKSPFVRAWMNISIKYVSPIVIVIIFLSQFIK
ncbi:sodium-dependent transporter [Peptoniphilus harei]|uniref:Transporter n=2 Tax=Peptoniphilus TaxID=162289 RepID=A0A133PQA5_9FIRM|nr:MULTISPECIES: sodium-dependent transporter [Peptoniphilus]KXA30810.1 Sodium:neurotransmitter symporter family protein [Peptoniphilus harei]MDK7355377.1 sodium-dependent transporter [Peptoniphilus harei]MDK7371006.1 sodium-dependent transporter [Peptoniphilus harei]MDU5324107.1 sodium-dependent transporter [Peptoniphilus harei]URN41155.1 sodium-dependent transporter [Peptoniphilus sp. SAHP1]